MNEAIEKLAELFYERLNNSENHELSFNEILDVLDTNPHEFHLRKVEGGGMRLLLERHKDVVRLKDENGKPYLKLNKK